MSHPEGNHLLAVHRVLTGQPSNPRGASDLDRVASRDDFPCYAAVLDQVRRRDDGIPSGVALPTPAGRRAADLARPGRRLSRPPPRPLAAPPRPEPARRAATTASPCPPGSTPSGSIAAATCSARPPLPSPGDAFVDQQDAALAMLCNGRVGQALDTRPRRPPPRRPLRPASLRPVAADGPAAGRGRRADRAGDDGDRADLGHARRQLPPAQATTCCPPLDRAVSALLDDLEARGLARRDAGRDARRVRPDARDLRADARRRARPRPLAQRSSRPSSPGAAWSAASSSASPTGWGPIPLSRSFGPPDLAATIYNALGVDPGDRAARPPRPALAALLGRGDDAALHHGGGLNPQTTAVIFVPAHVRIETELNEERSTSIVPIRARQCWAFETSGLPGPTFSFLRISSARWQAGFACRSFPAAR